MSVLIRLKRSALNLLFCYNAITVNTEAFLDKLEQSLAVISLPSIVIGDMNMDCGFIKRIAQY